MTLEFLALLLVLVDLLHVGIHVFVLNAQVLLMVGERYGLELAEDAVDFQPGLAQGLGDNCEMAHIEMVLQF